MMYMFEVVNDSILDIFEVEEDDYDWKQFEIENEGHQALTVSAEYLKGILDSCKKAFRKLTCVYERTLIDHVGNLKFQMLVLASEICFIKTDEKTGERIWVL